MNLGLFDFLVIFFIILIVNAIFAYVVESGKLSALLDKEKIALSRDEKRKIGMQILKFVQSNPSRITIEMYDNSEISISRLISLKPKLADLWSSYSAIAFSHMLSLEINYYQDKSDELKKVIKDMSEMKSKLIEEANDLIDKA